MKEKFEDEHRYDDMIDLPHPISNAHPQMPVRDRAAQFAPFAALAGYGAAVKETQRLTSARAELSESALAQLDQKLQCLREKIAEEPEVTITYFRPDERKSGGSYHTMTGKVTKLDEYRRRIILDTGDALPVSQIEDMTGDCFEDL